jgi:predicted lipoprotein with Yx(FWY)xxD motif
MVRRRLAIVILTAAALTLAACARSESGTAAPASSASEPTSPTPPAGNGSQPRVVAEPVAVNLVPPDSGDFAKYTADSSPETKAAAMQWTALGKAKVIDLDPVVVNANGMVLYRYDEDTATPSKSHCTDACAETWLPVLIAPNGTIYLTDVPKSSVGTVAREDGTLQVTLGGQPIYRYVEDETMGDRKGQGVDGAWSGVRPDGGKATPESSGADISITLYPEKDFAGDAQGTSGPGCQNLPEPGTFASLQLSGGSAELWSREDCTGKSTPVNSEVRDLSTIGVNDKVSSVKFGG